MEYVWLFVCFHVCNQSYYLFFYVFGCLVVVMVGWDGWVIDCFFLFISADIINQIYKYIYEIFIIIL